MVSRHGFLKDICRRLIQGFPITVAGLMGLFTKNNRNSMQIDAKRRFLARLPKSFKPKAKLVYFLLKMPFGGQKSLNKGKYQIAVSKAERINFVPPIFSVTVSSSCNLRCPNCYYVLLGGENAFQGGGMIKVDDFKAIIDKYGKYVELVSMTGGEALGHPHLDQLVDIVKRAGSKASVNTNGIFIERKIETLKAFDSVNVSLDGYDYESFNKYRGGTAEEFDKILKGLKMLRENDISFSNSFVLSEENVHEVDSMLKFADTTKPARVVFYNINGHGCDDFKPLVAGNEKVQKMLREVTDRNDYPFDIELPVIFDPESTEFMSYKCTQQWAMSCFNDKGDVAYCCFMDHDSSIGNMFKGYDFNSEKMRTFRKQMVENEYPKDSCLLCQRRFVGQEYGIFNASQGSWILQGGTGSGKKLVPSSVIV